MTTSEAGLTGAPHPIRLVMADDHPIVLEGLASLVQQATDIQLLACCNSGSAVLEAISRHQPDVVLLDIQMPAPNGLAVLRELRRLGSDTKVVLLTASVQDDDVLEAVRLGIRGLVPKDALTEKVVECVRIVARGGSCLDPTLVGHAMAKLLTREAGLRDISRVLTPREVQILELIAAGRRNRAIAEQLFVSEGTIKVHLHHIYEKLGVDSREQLIAYARERGLG